MLCFFEFSLKHINVALVFFSFRSKTYILLLYSLVYTRNMNIALDFFVFAIVFYFMFVYFRVGNAVSGFVCFRTVSKQIAFFEL